MIENRIENEPYIVGNSYYPMIVMAKIAITKVTRRYQVTIPQSIRETMEISEGDYFAVVASDEEIIFKKVKLPSWDEIFERGEKSAKAKGISESDILRAIAEERGSE